MLKLAGPAELCPVRSQQAVRFEVTGSRNQCWEGKPDRTARRIEAAISAIWWPVDGLQQ